MKTCSIFRM